MPPMTQNKKENTQPPPFSQNKEEKTHVPHPLPKEKKS